MAEPQKAHRLPFLLICLEDASTGFPITRYLAFIVDRPREEKCLPSFLQVLSDCFSGSDIVGIGNWETSTINAEQYFNVENVTER